MGQARRRAYYTPNNTTKKRAGIVIRNATEQTFVDKVRDCHSHLNTELGINADLNIERHLSWGRDTWYAGYFDQQDNLVNINFERLYGFPLRDILKVLCHEMRHAYQYDKGWFGDPNSDRFRDVRYRSKGRIESDYWKGKEYDRWEYKDCPWEVDANAHEEPYLKLLIRAGLITEAQLKMCMTGDKHQRIDYTELDCLINKRYNKESTQRFVAYEDPRQERKHQDQKMHNKYAKLFKQYGYTYDKNKGNWSNRNTARPTPQAAKEFNKLWKQYKQESKWRQRKDGVIVVGLSELPEKFKGWSNKAQECYWANEDLFTKNFIAYPKYNLTFRDLTC